MKTKDDKKSPDFGLENIDKGIKKYNDDLHIESNENLFINNCLFKKYILMYGIIFLIVE